MKKSSRNLFLASTIGLSVTISTSHATDKAASGTELTDGASWGGTAPSAADTAAWTASSLTGAQTANSPVTWRQMSFANTTALSISGSQISLAGANSNGSYDVITGSASGGTSVANDLLLTGVSSTSVIAVGNTSTRLQLNSASSTTNLTLGNVTSNGGGLVNDANVFLRGTGSNVINGTLTVDGQVGKGDTGTWTLNGSNSMGWFYVNNGTVLAGNNGAFGTGTFYLGSGGGNVTLGSSTSTARSFANNLDFTAGTGFVSTVSLGQTTGGTGALTFSGNVNLGTAQRIISTNVETTFSGVLSGAGGGFNKTGNGTLILTNANTMSGSTHASAGILALGNNAALGTSQLRMNGGTIASSDSTARVVTTGKQLDFALNSTFGSTGTGDLEFTDTVGLGTLSDKTATVSNGVTTFSGVVSDGSAGARSFIKAGTGNLILSGNNTYNRTTVVNAGTLTAGHVNAFGVNGSALTVNGGTLALGTYNINKNAITLNGGRLTGSAYTGAVTIGGDAAISGGFAGTLNTGTSSARAIDVTGGLSVGTLTGQGAFSGGTVNVSTQHNPGNSPGSQTFADGLTYADGSVLNIEIAADGLTFDLVGVTDGLAIGNNVSLNLSLSGAADYTASFWDTSHGFTFLTADAITGDFASVSFGGLGDPSGQGSWSLEKDLTGPGGFTAMWSAIPEPSVTLLGGLGLLGLLRRRRCQDPIGK